jgi:hypothetical protein
MVERGSTYRFRSSATAQVEAMNREFGFERGLSQASGIASLAGSFQSVDENQIGLGLSYRPLRVHEHLHAGFGFKEAFGDREAPLIECTRPEVSCEGGQMRIPEKGTERLQIQAYMETATQKVYLANRAGDTIQYGNDRSKRPGNGIHSGRNGGGREDGQETGHESVFQHILPVFTNPECPYFRGWNKSHDQSCSLPSVSINSLVGLSYSPKDLVGMVLF